MKIKILEQKLTVCKVKDLSKVKLETEICFLGITEEENSLVCCTEDVPEDTIIREDGWRGFRIVGTLDFSLVGILARIASLLAEHKISIFAISTFNTDYVLTKEKDFEKAIGLLKESGYDCVS